MDGSAFDHLTKTLTDPGSRRRALGGILAGTLGLVGTEVEHAAAKKKPCPPCKKRKKGKCKAKLPDGTPCADGTCLAGRCAACTPTCAGKTCGSDGCDGTCGSCLGGTCTDDTCTCPAERPELCGEQCRAACAATQTRHPQTCACCVTFGNTCQQPSNCCSGICQGGRCEGVAPGAACTFDAQCGGARRCISGMCTCRPTASYCLDQMTDAAPDLLITDLVMPGLAGWSVMLRPRSLIPWLPIIVISGTDMRRPPRTPVLGDPTVVLRKPFGLETLLAEVARLLPG